MITRDDADETTARVKCKHTLGISEASLQTHVTVWVSLERLKPGAYGNDAANLLGSPGAPSPGLENDGNRSPRVNAGVDLVAEAALFPVALELVGSGEDDGSPGPLRFQWTQINGPAPVVWAAPTAARSSVGFPTAGTYLLRLSATDGELEASDDMTVTIDRESVVATLVKPGSTWRFLDDGSNQGPSGDQQDLTIHPGNQVRLRWVTAMVMKPRFFSSGRMLRTNRSPAIFGTRFRLPMPAISAD